MGKEPISQLQLSSRGQTVVSYITTELTLCLGLLSTMVSLSLLDVNRLG